MAGRPLEGRPASCASRSRRSSPGPGRRGLAEPRYLPCHGHPAMLAACIKPPACVTRPPRLRCPPPEMTGRNGASPGTGAGELDPVLKLLAFVLPLGLDSFAVAAAIGAMQVTSRWQRLRISLVFVIFEGGMPLTGLALGTALAHGIGQVADYLAGAAVIAVGAWMLLAGDKDQDEKAAANQQPRASAHRARDQHQPGRAGRRIHHRPRAPGRHRRRHRHRPAGFPGRATRPRDRRPDRGTMARTSGTARGNRADTARRLPHRRAPSPVSAARSTLPRAKRRMVPGRNLEPCGAGALTGPG